MSHVNHLCHERVSLVTCEWFISHVNESCHMWMSHITYAGAMSPMWMSHVIYEWVMSHMHESCHICMSHDTYARAMSHMNKSCHVWMSHVTCEWVMSHVDESCHMCMSHVTFVNEPCHIWMSHVTYEWVMSHMHESYHMWMSHVTCEWVMSHMHESCHTCISHITCEWVMSHMKESSHIWMSHVTYKWAFLPCQVFRPCEWMSHVTYEWVMTQVSYERTMSHIWMSHVTYEWTILPCQVYRLCEWTSHVTLIEETAPPGGVSYLLCSLIKNPEEEDPPRRICTKCFEGGPLPPGSWLGNIVNRKPPPGGGVIPINLYERVTSHMNKSCNIYKWVNSHTFQAPADTCQFSCTYMQLNWQLQHTATRCNTPRHPYAATHCNTLQHVEGTCRRLSIQRRPCAAATHCNTLQPPLAATHWTNCNMFWAPAHAYHFSCTHMCTHMQLQNTETNCNTLQHIETHCNTLQHPLVNRLQQTATDCNRLQHTATPSWRPLTLLSNSTVPTCSCIARTPFWSFASWKRHVIYEWVMSHINGLCHI